MMKRFATWFKSLNRVGKILTGILLFFASCCACTLLTAPFASKSSEDGVVESKVTEEVTVAIESSLKTEDMDVELSLPYSVQDSSGWVFTIHRIDWWDSIESTSKRYRPENEVFLLFIGEVSNRTDERACIKGQDFALLDGEKEYEMDEDIVRATQRILDLDYPGFFRGQCMNYDDTAYSFLIFDVPKGETNIFLRINDQDHIVGRVSSLIEATPVAYVTPTLVPTNTPAPTVTSIPSSTVPAATRSQSATSTPNPLVVSNFQSSENKQPAGSVVVSSANVRTGPGTNYEVVDTVLKDTIFLVLASNDNQSWYLVDLGNNESAWIASSVIQIANGAETIPIALTIPAPPLTPIEQQEVPPKATVVTEPTNPPESVPRNPVFSNNEVDPPWWPCQEGQVKGNRDSGKYHVPGGRFYAKTYEGVDCFNSSSEAEAAGYIRSQR